MANLKTQQATKPATQAKPKAAPKATQATKEKTPFYAALLLSILAGEHGKNAASYYKTATGYHAKKGTKFPRVGEAWAATMAAKAEAEAMPKAKAVEWAKALIMRAGVNLPSRDAQGNALFDLMMTRADISNK